MKRLTAWLERRQAPRLGRDHEAAPAMSDHFVTIDLEAFSPGDRPHLTCKAPAAAMCHAVWSCECETWFKQGIEDGKPWHAPGDYSEPEYERHYGRFNPDECNLRDWAENSDECLRGKVMLPVSPERESDVVLFHVAGPGQAVKA